jgi:tol-pal system protein YbgF
MKVTCISALLTLALLPGCRTTASPELKTLTKQIEELSQKEEQNERQVEELSTRLFLLEDKVDTERVARESSGKPPRLPVIRIRPEEPRPEPVPEVVVESDEQPARPRGRGKSVVSVNDVTYGGAAARQDGPRPVLRLYGSSPGNGTATVVGRGPEVGSGTDPRLVTEKLPVIPMPRRAKSRAGAPGVDDKAAVKSYKEALAKYRLGDYPAAIKAFSRFAERHAGHQHADNAVYWKGECYYDTRDYPRALTTFKRVVEQYPAGNKAPDALLKMAYCYIKMKEPNNARSVLEQVVESYPGSRVSRIAEKTLKTVR